MKRPKVRLSPDVRRMCRGCCRMFPETDLKRGDRWECAECAAQGPPPMPLTNRGLRDVYDTSAVFAGYILKRIPQGEKRNEWEAYIPCRMGEFFAAGERTVGFETKTTRCCSILAEQFPGVRVITHGDDGHCVLHMSVDLFPAVAKRVGAHRRPQLSDKERSERSERMKAINAKARFGSSKDERTLASEQVLPQVDAKGQFSLI